MRNQSINDYDCQEKEDYGLGEYVTIHITPEPQFSYVSFESNIPAASYLSIVTNILNTFNPGKFILTIFATKVSGQRRCRAATCKYFCRPPWRPRRTRSSKFAAGSEIGSGTIFSIAVSR